MIDTTEKPANIFSQDIVNVLVIAHDSGLFGAQRSLLEFVTHIDKAKYRCHVVAPSEGPFVDAARSAGVPVDLLRWVRWVPASGELRRSGRLKCSARFVRGLAGRVRHLTTIIRQRRIDAVYSNTVVMVEGAIAAKVAGIRHMWHIHEPIFGNPELGALLPNACYAKLIDRLADRVVFPSAAILGSYGPIGERAAVVFSGLPVPGSFDRASARQRLAETCGFSAKGPVVAVVGSLQPRKDQSTFVRAAAILHRKRPDVVFIIAGADVSGSMSSLKLQIESAGLAEVVHMVGWWPGDTYQLMAAIDVLAISSVQESFGLTVIEAFSVGTPVVSTRCGGPEEIVRHGVDGILVPIGDADAMAAGWDELIDNPDRAAEFGRAGRDQFLKLFTIESHVAGICRILNSMLPSTLRGPLVDLG